MNRKKILVVEDEMDFAEILKMRLEWLGGDVTVAQDATRALEILSRNDFHLVVLDLKIPNGGGYAVLDRLREQPEKSMTPVVILTGKTIDEEMEQKMKDYQVSALFMKPYEHEEFVDKIKSLLEW